MNTHSVMSRQEYSDAVLSTTANALPRPKPTAHVVVRRAVVHGSKVEVSVRVPPGMEEKARNWLTRMPEALAYFEKNGGWAWQDEVEDHLEFGVKIE